MESSPVVYVAHYGGIGQSSFLPPDEEGIWTERDVHVLRASLLEETIRQALDGRESLAERQEAIEWLLGDDEGTFSMTACCIDGGLNVQALRELVLAKTDNAILEASRKKAVVLEKKKLTDHRRPLLWKEDIGNKEALAVSVS